MTHPSIRLEGSLLSADILDAIERGEKSHQGARDFGLEGTAKVKDEIAEAWAAARTYWAAYQVRLGRLREGATGTSETRNLWMVPFLELLGYHLALTESETISGKTYRVSHRDATRDQLPVHLIGWNESLDRRSTTPGAPRMSPHGLVQEYLNLTEHLYGVVSNGRLLRLLRDSSRLVNLTFIEFDLERIFTEELFADFALLYRLLHATRLPVRQDAAGEAPIEIYHQDSLDSGSRIRDGLSAAVQSVILSLANGFLNHPDNKDLHALAEADTGGRFAMDFYAKLLRLVYRLLFLMVIEERGLVHVPGTSNRLRSIYERGYSLARLRRLAEKSHFADPRHRDAWLALVSLFRLVDESGRGKALGVATLAGDIFGSGTLSPLESCSLDNATFLGALRQLTLFTNPVTRQLMRVNYGALNVEEFGSVYQGLLEFEPTVSQIDGKWHFAFAQGDERAATGSHYTPDELVQPLLKHSLEHLIAEKIQGSASPASEPERRKAQESALLSLRVADISCGSGHILLAAARRIATELAIVRTGDDQPSPAAFRSAVRDVIRECIYGVDLNPLAVELCKVALWLEAHVPGEPLNFLDHHIKCGNAIVGFTRREELDKGVPDEAFKTLPGDDKDIAAAFRTTNKSERLERVGGQKQLPLAPELQEKLDSILTRWREVSALPEHDPAEIEAKKLRYEAFNRKEAFILRQIAAIPIAQFYQPKTASNKASLVTDAGFLAYLAGRTPQGQATASAWALAARKRAFHWFLEFPEIIARGGFDCIVGNPPYLGGTHLSGTYGHPFCEYVRWEYAPTGLSDLVVFFVRRIFALLRPNGFTAFITTNSIKDGDIRKDGLEQVIAAGGTINMAVRGIKWPGVANLVVSLVSICKGPLGKRDCFLDGHVVPHISALFEDYEDAGMPQQLTDNVRQIFEGVKFHGDGFLLTHTEAEEMLVRESRLRNVIFPCLNGEELNNSPEQTPGRHIINFLDWPLEKAKSFGEAFERVLVCVKPYRDSQNDVGGREKWWQFLRPRMEMYSRIKGASRCFVAAATTKHLNFSAVDPNTVFTHALKVFTTDRWDHYAVVQSTIHEVWARKYSGALETRLRYSPSDCFETFAFPAGQWQHSNPDLAAIGEAYHEHRRKLMLRLWLGLTDIYNLFHTPDLAKRLEALFKRRMSNSGWRTEVPEEHRATAGTLTHEQARDGILRLRSLHVALDQAVLSAYGWHEPGPDGPAIALAHDFQEVETLPENDRTRYTITPAARKDLLTRLLKLNHTRAAEEAANAPAAKSKKAQRKKAADELL